MAVYFIQDGGPEGEIKIGYSTGDPIGRLRSFRTGNPRPLKLLVAIPGGAKEEAMLHLRFKDLRGHGEWFRADARLLGFIEGLLVAYPDQPRDDGRTDDAFIGLTGQQMEAIQGLIAGCLLRQRGATAANVDMSFTDEARGHLLTHGSIDAPPHTPYEAGLFRGISRAEIAVLLNLIESRATTERSALPNYGESFNGVSLGQLATIAGYIEATALKRRTRSLEDMVGIDENGAVGGTVDSRTMFEALGVHDELERIGSLARSGTPYGEGARAVFRSEGDIDHAAAVSRSVLDMFNAQSAETSLAVAYMEGVNPDGDDRLDPQEWPGDEPDPDPDPLDLN